MNKGFLDSTDSKVKDEILDNIAKDYGITKPEAYEEVTGDEAEHLLDYIKGSMRAATSVLMQRYYIQQ